MWLNNFLITLTAVFYSLLFGEPSSTSYTSSIDSDASMQAPMQTNYSFDTSDCYIMSVSDNSGTRNSERNYFSDSEMQKLKEAQKKIELEKKSLEQEQKRLKRRMKQLSKTSKNKNSGISKYKHKLPPFNIVEINGVCDLTINQTSKENTLEVNRNRPGNKFDYYVEGNVLVLNFQSTGNNNKTEDVSLKLACQDISRISVNGIVNLRIEKNFNVARLAIESNGIGDIEMNHLTAYDLQLYLNGLGSIKADNISSYNTQVALNGRGDITISHLESESLMCGNQGSGDISISGWTSDARIVQTGAGNINIDYLKADYITAQNFGPGNIICFPKTALYAENLGPGLIRYKGKPKTLKISNGVISY